LTIVVVPDAASDDIKTMENVPIAIDNNVRADRNLCIPMTDQPTRRNSMKSMVRQQT
jgi:hypothetical protein